MSKNHEHVSRRSDTVKTSFQPEFRDLSKLRRFIESRDAGAAADHDDDEMRLELV
jgi:hypothetical protein